MFQNDQPQLTLDQAFEVLDRLRPQHFEKLILVGGQAAAFWIIRYQAVSPDLLATKDIDVFLNDESVSVAVECAKDLGGKFKGVRGARVRDVSRVDFVSHGSELTIDFLRSIYRVNTSDLIASKLLIADQPSVGKDLYVMHPIFSLASRLFNAFGLPGRLTNENLTRLRYSIDAARSFLCDQLLEKEAYLEVRESIEKLFEISRSREGLSAWNDHRIDVFAAVPDKTLLAKCGAEFISKRHPQMLELLQKKRAIRKTKAVRVGTAPQLKS